MIPVEGYKNLFRDEKTGAIVNTDTIGYSQYIRMREERKKQRQEIDDLKNDIIEIKSLLGELINETRRNRTF
jgi:hypothetical protein